MGNSESVPNAHEYRLHNAPVKLPMPDQKELNTRFDKVLGSMNLSADKVKILSGYDNDKKWELICDQEKVSVKNPPKYYIQILLSYINSSVKSKTFKRRIANSTHTLRELEISLRTNHIGWVREFLNEENRGLDVLVEYLSFAHLAFKYGDRNFPASTLSSPSRASGSTGDLSIGYASLPSIDKRSSVASSITRHRNRSFPNKRTLKNSRTIVERDDVHVCITCLRTIMNYQYGFNLVMEHPDCINEIALGLNHKTSRTKVLVLELLAAVCLVRGGHDIILQAFDNFKVACNESRRFSKLMQYFKFETDNVDFMVMCMQFINIMVHSVEDMNFRVHLQYEFTMLGLDDYLETLRETESDRLKVQIQAYLDNMFDVSALLEDSEVKLSALERIENLEDQILSLNEKIQEQEYENMTTIVELEKQLSAKDREIVDVKDLPLARSTMSSFQSFHARIPGIRNNVTSRPFSKDPQSPFQSTYHPKMVIPVELVQSPTGLRWTSNPNDTIGSMKVNGLEEMAQREMLLIPSEVWQDLEKMNFKIPRSPSAASLHSGSTSGSSGFTTDTSFQYKRNIPIGDSISECFSEDNLLSLTSKTISMKSISSDVKDHKKTSSLPRKPGHHRYPRFYMDGEDYIEFDDLVLQRSKEQNRQKSTDKSSPKGNVENEYESIASYPISKQDVDILNENLVSKGVETQYDPDKNISNFNYGSIQPRNVSKKGFTKKEYTVLPEITEKNNVKVEESDMFSSRHKLHELPSLGDDAPEIPSEIMQKTVLKVELPVEIIEDADKSGILRNPHKLPSLGENAREIPVEAIHSDYLEDLPPPPDTLLFNKNAILPAIVENTTNHSTKLTSTTNMNHSSQLLDQIDLNEIEVQYDTRVTPPAKLHDKNMPLATTSEGNHDAIGAEYPEQLSNEKVIFSRVMCVVNAHVHSHNSRLVE